MRSTLFAATRARSARRAASARQNCSRACIMRTKRPNRSIFSPRAAQKSRKRFINSSVACPSQSTFSWISSRSASSSASISKSELDAAIESISGLHAGLGSECSSAVGSRHEGKGCCYAARRCSSHMVLAARYASASARDWIGCPLCPLIHFHWILSAVSSRISSVHISRCRSSAPLRFRHPWLCQRKTNVRIPHIRYSESDRSSTTDRADTDRKAWIAARSSISSMVVQAVPPDISHRLFPWIRTAPHPPGPGFPIAEPSVNTWIVLSIASLQAAALITHSVSAAVARVPLPLRDGVPVASEMLS